MLKKLTRLAVLPMLCLLSGCAMDTLGIDSGCKSFKPISASKADTTDTKRQVIGHNRAWNSICDDKKFTTLALGVTP